MSHDRPFKRARSDWTEVVLVCRKCSKKLDGGFGDNGDQRLAKALRKSIAGKGRKARAGVVEVGCFDVCPKNAVVAVLASNPGDWVVVPRGASTAAVAQRLGLDAAALGDRPEALHRQEAQPAE
ncbi:MAG: (2Fe-2S) ferredoxin domain-containing protein [Gemmatimonadaceae bacterium]|uniref:(2Fe-2S) ferredoxin domain-containing protein n=1 Tax=Caulobacter sp. DWP3-1-3b2 TaxID=2804643 RepID=UPI0019A74E6E|nr:(2Fe-2S) ferredoxin domain-containing protein [Caulobacter sp.]